MLRGCVCMHCEDMRLMVVRGRVYMRLMVVRARGRVCMVKT